MYPGHYPSKTGTVCFQPIAWPMEGVVLDFISACNRLGFQTDREHPLLVNTQHFFNNQFLQEIKKTATQHPTQRAEKTCGAHHKKKSCHQDGQAGATSADTGVFLATQMMMSRCDLKKIFPQPQATMMCPTTSSAIFQPMMVFSDPRSDIPAQP